jgi:Bacterial SH3 domain
MRLFASLSGIALISLLGLGCAVSSSKSLVAVDDTPSGRGTESVRGDLTVGSTLRSTANVNLRNGPSRSDDVLDVVPSGDTATLVESAPSNGYYHLQWNGEDGWSSGTYWQLVSSPSTPPTSPGSTGSSGGDAGTTTLTGAPWSCTGSYGKTPVDSGNYYITEFGCWIDSAGKAHGDSGDNCIPGCLAQAKSAGLCAPGSTGKACEQSVNWYVADAGRFGCLQRLRVTNPANGRSVIAIALDYGPACWVERSVSHGVLDASGAINRALFGSDLGVSDRTAVTVEAVSSDTPLGPE